MDQSFVSVKQEAIWPSPEDPSTMLCRNAPEIQNFETIRRMFSRAYCCPNTYSVTFLVQDEKFTAHRDILAIHSRYFRAMFLRKFEESAMKRDQPIVLHGKTARSFRAFLQYLYTGTLKCQEMDFKTLAEVYGLADYYEVGHLLAAFHGVFKGLLKDESAQIYELALLYRHKTLLQMCRYHFISPRNHKLIKPMFDSIALLSLNAVLDLLNWPELKAGCDELLAVIQCWSEMHPEDDPKPLLDMICFSDLTVRQLSLHQELLARGGFFDLQQIFNSLKTQTNASPDSPLSP